MLVFFGGLVRFGGGEVVRQPVVDMGVRGEVVGGCEVDVFEAEAVGPIRITNGAGGGGPDRSEGGLGRHETQTVNIDINQSDAQVLCSACS